MCCSPMRSLYSESMTSLLDTGILIGQHAHHLVVTRSHARMMVDGSIDDDGQSRDEPFPAVESESTCRITCTLSHGIELALLRGKRAGKADSGTC